MNVTLTIKGVIVRASVHVVLIVIFVTEKLAYNPTSNSAALQLCSNLH